MKHIAVMSNQQRTYSVVIPVYNGEQLISKAIKSCLAQTVLPNEIIVINDASTDKTHEMIQAIKSDIIVYVVNAENKGASFSRNAGMRIASSSWILFLDADDTFHNRKIEIIEKSLADNLGIKAIGHAFDLQKDTTEKSNPIKNPVPLPERFSVFQLLLRNRMVTPSLGVAATNNVFFNEALLYAEDHDFILRTAEQYGFWYIDVALCSLGRQPLTAGGLSGNKWKMRKGEMSMFINYCKRNSLYPLMPFFMLFSLFKHLRNALFSEARVH